MLLYGYECVIDCLKKLNMNSLMPSDLLYFHELILQIITFSLGD